MKHETEKIININFYDDGQITIDANGYNEELDSKFKIGYEKNIDVLKYKQACISDCYEIMKIIGDIEEIMPKKSKRDHKKNLVKVQ
jgi:hypothetical protein